MSNDKAPDFKEMCAGYTFDVLVRTGLTENDKNKELLNNLVQSRIFKNELEWIKIQAEKHATELFKKYLRKYKS
jgi:hypothetical protein